MLVKSTMCGWATPDGWQSRGRSHVLGAKPSSVDREGAMKWHQRSSNMGIITRVQTPPLSLAKEIVEVIVATPAVISSIVAQRLSAMIGNGLLVVAKMAIGLGCAMRIVTVRRGLAIGSRIGTHLMAIVIINAGRSYECISHE